MVGCFAVLTRFHFELQNKWPFATATRATSCTTCKLKKRKKILAHQKKTKERKSTKAQCVRRLYTSQGVGSMPPAIPLIWKSQPAGPLVLPPFLPVGIYNTSLPKAQEAPM